ncbi:MAG: GAF domain-containing protein [Chloroflexota bacterium]
MRLFEALRMKWDRFFQRWIERILARRWFDVGLRSKMSAMVTVGLIGLIGIFAFIAISTVRQATQQQLSEHVLRARMLAENLDASLSHVAGMLTILSPKISLDDPQADLQEWGAIFERDFQSIQGVYVFDSKGSMVAATAVSPGIRWEDVPVIQNMALGKPRSISIDGMPRPYAIVAVPIAHQHSAPGVLAAVIDLSNPDIFMSSGTLDLEHAGILQILDGKGQVLASTRPQRMLSKETIDKITQQLFVEEIPMFEACLGCTSNENTDTGNIIAFAPLSQAPWGVILWHDSQELFAPVRRLGLQTIVFGFLAILGALVLVFITTRSVILPVQALTDATCRISNALHDPSDLESVECTLANALAKKSVQRRDEIGILANSFLTMCNRLQQSMKEIQSWNRELDARVQARTQQLAILNAVALTVNQSLNLEDILNRALDEVLQLSGIDVVAIFLQDTTQGHLKLMAYRGLSEKAARLANQVGLLDGSCGGVMELGRAVVVPDLSQHRGRGAKSLQQEKIASLMHVPLMNKGWALGSMCVGTHHPSEFCEEEQSLLTAIGNQIAIAVENARLYGEVQQKEQIRRKLFKKSLAAQEDERKRIARELHDEVSQSLTALLYEAEDELELKHPPAIKKRLQSICDLSRHTLDNVHELIFDLRPSILDQLGLIPAVRWMAETRLEPKGIRVSVITSVDSDYFDSEPYQRLSPEIETTLYRVLQEAINNIARHSAARNVEINLDIEDDIAIISITDDGIGFDLTELNVETIKSIDSKDLQSSDNTRGLGLLGMQERVELLGGDLEINSVPGNGTQVYIHIPIEIKERIVAYD